MRRAVSRIIPSRHSKTNGKSGSNTSVKLEQERGAPTFIQSTNSSVRDPSQSISSTLNHSNFRIEFNSVAEFYITLDEPHKSWLPGDEVSGQIILISRKNLANIAITLSLVGCVKINASSHSKLRPLKHTLFNHTIKIYGDEADEIISEEEDQFRTGLYKGEHRFPFIVKLPNKRVYTSIDFGKGAIVYSLKAAIGNIQANGTSSNAATPTTSNNATVGAVGNTASAGSPNASASDSPSCNSTSNSNTTGSPGESSSPSGLHKNLIAKAKQLKILHNSTYTSERLINLINPIDVGKLPPPKPKRLILKDPRSNKKLSRTQSSTSTINTFTTLSSNNSDTQENATTTTIPENSTPTTSNNGNSNSNSLTATHNSLFPPITPLSDNSGSTPQTSQKKPDTIRVCLSIPDRGYLRGELIPIKLNINHLKKIQDLSGIIITFVRVCRLDNGSDGLFESFRKDLYQSIIPLYVDPNTFSSEISTSVRVPADAFPTISGCPLVSFQYFIEVLINLSGKSLSIDGSDGNNSSSNKESIIGAASAATGSASSFNFNFQLPHGSFDSKERSTYINTDKYKRMKKFLQLTTEVVIGTHRSKRVTLASSNDEVDSLSPSSRRSSLISGSGGSHSTQQQTPQQPSANVNPPQLSTNNTSQVPLSVEDRNIGGRSPTVLNSFSTPPYFGDSGPVPGYNEESPSGSDTLLPLPQQAHLSEKEQMKLREVSLMPSAPPLDDIEEDIHGVSPIDGNDDILQHISGAGLDNDEATGGQNFITTATSSGQGDENTNMEITMDQHNPNILEGDQYSLIDFVPKYESVNNDRIFIDSNQETGIENESSSNSSIVTKEATDNLASTSIHDDGTNSLHN